LTLDSKGGPLDAFPDLPNLSDQDLKALIDDLTRQEQEVSYQRRLLHARIDLLRTELVARLQKTGGQSVLDQVDIESLTEILAAKAAPPA
jgi:RsiG-like